MQTRSKESRQDSGSSIRTTSRGQDSARWSELWRPGVRVSAGLGGRGRRAAPKPPLNKNGGPDCGPRGFEGGCPCSDRAPLTSKFPVVCLSGAPLWCLS